MTWSIWWQYIHMSHVHCLCWGHNLPFLMNTTYTSWSNALEWILCDIVNNISGLLVFILWIYQDIWQSYGKLMAQTALVWWHKHLLHCRHYINKNSIQSTVRKYWLTIVMGTVTPTSFYRNRSRLITTSANWVSGDLLSLAQFVELWLTIREVMGSNPIVDIAFFWD